MPLKTTAVFGLQHISKCLEKKDTQSIQKWLRTVGASMPDTTTYERKAMAHVPSEGKGILSPNGHKKSDKSPDWKGQIMHNGETIKLAAWVKKSQYGEFFSLSVDNWKPDQSNPSQKYPRDVTPDAGDIPF